MPRAKMRPPLVAGFPPPGATAALLGVGSWKLELIDPSFVVPRDILSVVPPGSAEEVSPAD